VLVLGVLGEPSNILVSTCMTQELEGAQVKIDLLVPVFLTTGVNVRGSLGRLEEGRLADVALDVHSLLVLQHEGNVSQPLDFRIPQPEHRKRTTLSCDLAALLSFWLRSRFCCAFAPCS
jgi:hypothetical protein